jgi:hypothetical protein
MAGYDDEAASDRELAGELQLGGFAAEAFGFAADWLSRALVGEQAEPRPRRPPLHARRRQRRSRCPPDLVARGYVGMPTRDNSPTWTGPQWQPGHSVSSAAGASHG